MNKIPDMAIIGIETNIRIVDRGSGAIYDSQNDTLLVAKFDNAFLYRTSIKSTIYNSKAINNGQIEISDNPAAIKSKSFHHMYFVHYLNSNSGLTFEKDKGIKVSKFFKVDSLLFENPLLKGGRADFDEQSILFSKKDISKGLIKETYVYKSNLNGNYPDTTYLVFDPHWKNSSNYSLSQNIDKVKKMKLIQVSSVYNPTTTVHNNKKIEMPRRIIDVKIFKPILSNLDSGEIKQAFQNLRTKG
ncbi:hypothetical protein [Pedobacter nototheniae]|uniref:hypothetical protein n=1 Tax=Pedobacter nototheniae TaxID=2488994 RepID=UPI00103B2F9E|nr:hypothetical protein [Pedobacter nototheniae]